MYELMLLSSSGILVGPPAVEPDLQRRPGRRREASHPHHRLGEVAPERGAVAGVLAHQRVLRPTVEQLLVRMQQPALQRQRPEVAVVERVGGLRVQRRQAAVRAGPPGARLPQLRGEGGVHVGVPAVDTSPERDHRARPTVCAPDSSVMSRADRPLAASEATSEARLEPGPGRLALAAA